MLSIVKRFFAWALAGALISFGVLGAASIGLPFLLLGVVLTALLTQHIGGGEAYGAAFGVAAVLVVIGLINLPYHPCGPLGGSDPPMPGMPSECGGFNPLAFFVPAAIALAAGVAACFSSASHARQRQL
jgi:hypothetical protein